MPFHTIEAIIIQTVMFVHQKCVDAEYEVMYCLSPDMTSLGEPRTRIRGSQESESTEKDSIYDKYKYEAKVFDTQDDIAVSDEGPEFTSWDSHLDYFPGDTITIDVSKLSIYSRILYCGWFIKRRTQLNSTMVGP